MSDIPSNESPLFHMTVVIPVYNEEALLATAINDLMLRLGDIPLTTEVIISENGSKDRTREIARELAAKHRNIRVLNTDEPNYGRALRRGIEEARGLVAVASHTASYAAHAESIESEHFLIRNLNKDALIEPQ